MTRSRAEGNASPIRGGGPKGRRGFGRRIEIYYNTYKSKNIANARTLRKEMTRQERHLWYDFLRSYPIKIYRQKAIGEYIADFYCSKALLVIELDGGQHYEEEQKLYDQRRTQKLNELGIKVIRFTNIDVDRNFNAVCMEIDTEIKKRTNEPLSHA